MVKDVWYHYPEMEVPSTPKDNRVRLDVMLRRKSYFGNCHVPQVNGTESCEDGSVIREEEESDENFIPEFEQYPLVAILKSPSLSSPKINSITKLKPIDKIDEADDSITRERQLVHNLEVDIKGQDRFEVIQGRFHREKDSKNKFKVSRHKTPKGVLSSTIWRHIPVSPHIIQNFSKPHDSLRISDTFTVDSRKHHSHIDFQMPGRRNSEFVGSIYPIKKTENKSKFKDAGRSTNEPLTDMKERDLRFKQRLAEEVSKFGNKKFKLRSNLVQKDAVSDIAKEII